MDVTAAVAFLQKRKQASEAVVANLSAAIAALPDLSGEDAQARMAQVADASLDSALDELESWKEFLDEGGLPTPDKMATAEALATPIAASRRRTIQEKLASMGGVPALGGGVVLPFASASQRKSLISTASPAAQELTRTQFVRLKATDSAAAQQISKLSSAHATTGQSDGSALEAASEDEPHWKTQLKSRPPPSGGGALAPDTQSELAAALMRRRQAAQDDTGMAEGDKGSDEEGAASDLVPESGS